MLISAAAAALFEPLCKEVANNLYYVNLIRSVQGQVFHLTLFFQLSDPSRCGAAIPLLYEGAVQKDSRSCLPALQIMILSQNLVNLVEKH